MYIASYYISRIVGESNIWQFVQNAIGGILIYKLVVLSTVWTETNTYSINGQINGIHRIWWSLQYWPNYQIKITTKQTVHTVVKL